MPPFQLNVEEASASRMSNIQESWGLWELLVEGRDSGLSIECVSSSFEVFCDRVMSTSDRVGVARVQTRFCLLQSPHFGKSLSHFFFLHLQEMHPFLVRLITADRFFCWTLVRLPSTTLCVSSSSRRV